MLTIPLYIHHQIVFVQYHQILSSQLGETCRICKAHFGHSDRILKCICKSAYEYEWQ